MFDGYVLCSSVCSTLIRLRLAQPPEGNVVHQTVSFFNVFHHLRVVKSDAFLV